MDARLSSELVAGGAHVWLVRLEDAAPRARALSGLLDTGERRRAAAFARDVDRSRFVVSHAATRQILAGYIGAEPASLRFSEGPYGKPALARRGPHFSLSHSDGVALVAVAPDRPVGVDVERVREDCDVSAIAERFFTADEGDLLLTSRGAACRTRFFRLWTCKESCVKADGKGLRALERIAISLDEGVGMSVDRDGRHRTARWRIAELEPEIGYVAAVAAAGRPLSLRLLTWNHYNPCSDMIRR